MGGRGCGVAVFVGDDSPRSFFFFSLFSATRGDVAMGAAGGFMRTEPVSLKNSYLLLDQQECLYVVYMVSKGGFTQKRHTPDLFRSGRKERRDCLCVGSVGHDEDVAHANKGARLYVL